MNWLKHLKLVNERYLNVREEIGKELESQSSSSFIVNLIMKIKENALPPCLNTQLNNIRKELLEFLRNQDYQMAPSSVEEEDSDLWMDYMFELPKYFESYDGFYTDFSIIGVSNGVAEVVSTGDDFGRTTSFPLEYMDTDVLGEIYHCIMMGEKFKS